MHTAQFWKRQKSEKKQQKVDCPTGDRCTGGMTDAEHTNDENEHDEIVNCYDRHRQQPAPVERSSTQWTSATETHRTNTCGFVTMIGCITSLARPSVCLFVRPVRAPHDSKTKDVNHLPLLRIITLACQK